MAWTNFKHNEEDQVPFPTHTNTSLRCIAKRSLKHHITVVGKIQIIKYRKFWNNYAARGNY